MLKPVDINVEVIGASAESGAQCGMSVRFPAETVVCHAHGQLVRGRRF